MAAGSILIVDDQQSMCEMLETDLRLRGHRTQWCLSALAALEIVREQDIDVVLTDVRMPGTSGLQLCDELQRTRPDIAVVVMTAFGSLETAVAAIRAGAYDFITKPVELDLALTSTKYSALTPDHRELVDEFMTLLLRRQRVKKT